MVKPVFAAIAFAIADHHQLDRTRFFQANQIGKDMDGYKADCGDYEFVMCAVDEDEDVQHEVEKEDDIMHAQHRRGSGEAKEELV